MAGLAAASEIKISIGGPSCESPQEWREIEFIDDFGTLPEEDVQFDAVQVVQSVYEPHRRAMREGTSWCVASLHEPGQSRR